MKKHSFEKISPFAILMLLATITVFLLALFEPGKTNREAVEIKNSQNKNLAISKEATNQLSQKSNQETPEAENIYPLASPLHSNEERVTKKPFGIFITPQSSPVQPERFRGFHTGTDFEVFPEELESVVEVRSICEGEIVEKRNVGGYGGVVIQKCILNDKPVTVLYGHLSLDENSVIGVGDSVKGGQFLASLGDDKSFETDGERKHLHLSIHKGSAIELRGYVSSENELHEWINFEKTFESQTN